MWSAWDRKNSSSEEQRHRVGADAMGHSNVSLQRTCVCLNVMLEITVRTAHEAIVSRQRSCLGKGVPLDENTYQNATTQPARSGSRLA